MCDCDSCFYVLHSRFRSKFFTFGSSSWVLLHFLVLHIQALLFPPCSKASDLGCILQVAKADVTLSTTNNQPRSVALEVDTTMHECVVPRNEGEPNLTEQVHQKLLKDYFNKHCWSFGPQYNGPSSLLVFTPKDETSRVQNFCQKQI